MDGSSPTLSTGRVRDALRHQALPVAAAALALGGVAVLLHALGRAYLLVFTMNLSMVSFALAVVIFRRYRDWRILPLALLFFWDTCQQTAMAVAETLAVSPPRSVLWLMANPLVAPTILGFAAVVFLWRVFAAQADLQQREAQLAERLRQAQKLESLGVMAGGVAHDFNTLLTTIVGNAAILQMDLPAASEDAACARAIQAAAEKAANISRQMLDYTGCGKFRVETLALEQVVAGHRDLLATFVPDRIALTLDLGAAETWVQGDASQLAQVVANLLTNAVEATSGEGTVFIRVTRTEADEADLADGANVDSLPPGAYAALEVEDQGEGMDEETRRRMFDPFFSRRGVGRGMGLAAVLGIVRGHHGTVRVRTRPGGGTCIQVLLPLATAPAGAAPS